MQSAVLLLTFNRPDHTAELLEALRKVCPKRIYVATDGPRANKPEDAAKVSAVHDLVRTRIDWPCTVKTFFRDSNVGCRRNNTAAITWFFESEERGIILEDDCLPDPSFFPFCDELLERYADDERIWTISGNDTRTPGASTATSYFFSTYFHCWGWASWRRAWKHFPQDISQTCGQLLQKDLKGLPGGGFLYSAYWKQITRSVRDGRFDSWAYPFFLSSLVEGALHAHPTANLVQNTGFGEDSTHTQEVPDDLSPETRSIQFPLRHPPEVSCDGKATNSISRFHYNINPRSAVRMKLSLVKRMLKEAAGQRQHAR